MTPALAATLPDGAQQLLDEAGLTGRRSIVPLAGGRNNRVFLVATETRRALLKRYFYHPADPRDRLGNEVRFVDYAWQQGIRAVPEPIACAPDDHLALFSFVEGRRLRADEVDLSHLGDALDFFRALNRTRDRARHIGNGSEACFSLAEHLSCIDRRIARLEAIREETSLGIAAVGFLRHELRPAWQALRELSRQRARAHKIDLSAPLRLEQRILSPSDFGFHNALYTPDHRLIFHDFEYAGWDDPAKLVCDFFCQVEVPIDRRHFGWFAAAVAACTTDPLRLMQRIELLFPVYQTKWCTILLNEFLPVDGARRSFSEPTIGEERKRCQLDLARHCLGQIAGRI